MDTEHAQEQTVINAVNIKLRQYVSSPCSIPEYIVKLRNYLPNLEEALKAVKGLDHLQSPDGVNLLTQKFNERTLHEWDYFRSKSSGSTYERFTKFLEDRYDASKSSIARTEAAALSSGLDPSKLPPQNVNHTTTKGKDNMLPKSPDSDCKRCRLWTAKDQIYTCPGCGRGTQVGARIHHCLEHCGAYMAMSPNERGSCIEQAKWYPLHLVSSHMLADCNVAQDPNSVCGVNGCAKH